MKCRWCRLLERFDPDDRRSYFRAAARLWRHVHKRHRSELEAVDWRHTDVNRV